MKKSSVSARVWAILMAAALIFAQVTLAAYACPATPPQKASSMSAMSGDCHEADPASRHLCAKTCQDEPQNQETTSLDVLPPCLDASLRIAAREPRFLVARAHEFSLAHATSPPASILYSRFLK